MKKLLKRFEEFFKKYGYLNIDDFDYYYSNEIGKRFYFDEEFSILIVTEIIFEQEYYNDFIECHPFIEKASNVDEAWKLIKSDVSNEIDHWIHNHADDNDFNNDPEFMAFIDRVLDPEREDYV